MGRWIWSVIKAAMYLTALYALFFAAQWLTMTPAGKLSASAGLAWAGLGAVAGFYARRTGLLDPRAIAVLAVFGVFAAWRLAPTLGWGAAWAAFYWAPSAAGWLISGTRRVAALSLPKKREP